MKIGVYDSGENHSLMTFGGSSEDINFLVRLLLQLAFKVDRNPLIMHLEMLIFKTQNVNDEGGQDYSLKPLSPLQEEELEEMCNELIFNDSKEQNSDSDQTTLRYDDEFGY